MTERRHKDGRIVPAPTSSASRPSQVRSADAIKLVMDGPITISLPPTLIKDLLESAAKAPTASTETYDVASTDLPLGRRRFRRGCREGWWPSWRGPHGRHTALRSDVDAWVRNHAPSTQARETVDHANMANELMKKKKAQMARRRK